MKLTGSSEEMKVKVIEGDLVARDVQIAIVAGRFNEVIVNALVEGAKDALVRHGMNLKNIDLIKVPGAFEIPLAAKAALSGGNTDAVVCVGAVIRGATPHFDHISSAVTQGVAAVARDTSIPVGFGVLTCDTIEQAIERAGTKAGNKGLEAALAAIEMMTLFRRIRE